MCFIFKLHSLGTYLEKTSADYSFSVQGISIPREFYMKKQFQSDEEIPQSVWQLFPQYKHKLDRIIEMDEQLSSAINNRKRISFAINSEPEFKTKILRIHIRHQFHPSTVDDKAHHIITVEGHLLDKNAAKQFTFGNFLEKIRIQLDKRFHPVNSLFEWSAETYPEGVKAHSFRVKVYGDKSFPIKVFIHRSNDIRNRYELSSSLRDVLPSMQVDPTEEQVLSALWTLMSTNSMMEGRDRRQVKCSPELKNLFGVDTMSLSSLRQRVADHLTPSKAIQIEYSVTNTSFVPTSSFGPSTVAKGGGKAFDIEVDIKDPYAFDLLESVNEITKNQREIMEVISAMEQKASFLANAIIDSSNAMFTDLEILRSNPFSVTNSSSPKSLMLSNSRLQPDSRLLIDPLLSTARGDSAGFSMGPCMHSDMLLRASEPFSLISRRRSTAAVPTRRILRPQRAENADSFNGSSSTSDSAQSAPDIVSTSTPPSPSPPAAAASSSSSAESKDENENGDGDGGKDGDDSATSDIIGNSNSSSSGGTDQEVTASSITAKGSSAGDADMDVEEDQTVASSVKQEIDTALPEHKEGEGALSSIPSVAPVPSLSLSSTSVDEQGDKVALKEDEVQDNAMDVDKDVEVKGEGEGEVMMEVKGEGEVKMEVEGEREGEGDVEVKDTVKDEEEEKEKEKKPDQTILDQSASGPELKSELTEVSSTDATNPDPVTGAAADSSSVAVVSGDVTSDATEGSVSSETKATEEGMVVDLLPVKSEIKDEPVASSSASSSSASSSSSSASSSTTSAPAPAPAPDSKDDKAVVKDEKKITPSSSTDTSSKAKDAAAAAAAVVPPVMPESLPRAPDTFSAIHSLRGYLDVGSASLFAPSEPWVLATASLLMKRKLSKS